jgi:hypothetical protein
MDRRWAKRLLLGSALSLILSLAHASPARARQAASTPPRPVVQASADGASATCPAAGSGMCRYLFDWGDGTQGAGSPVNPGFPGRATHAWSTPGKYRVRARVILADGRASDWSEPYEVDVRAAHAGPRPLRSLTVRTSSAAPGVSGLGLLSGRGWRSAGRSEAAHPEWIVVDLGSPRAVSQIALEPLPNGEAFPTSFSVEYCTDAGRTWYALPIYSFGDYPNPADRTVLLETGLLCARQIRITATRPARTPSGYAFGLRRLTLRAIDPAPLFTSRGGQFDADLNNMWSIYGLACNEIAPKWGAWWEGPGGMRAMGSTEWHEWDVMKLGWTDLPDDRSQLRYYLFNMPMDADGYVWACDGGRLHLNAQKHFDYGAIHILAALKYCLWTGETGFFSDLLPAAARAKCPAGVKTMLDRLRKEMDYQLDALHGAEGLLRIPDADYDGTPGSKGTTYWDAYPAGYLSAYPNALFYASVQAMAEIERIAGDPEHRDRLIRLLPLIKERFNRTFWSESKGRFISTVDKTGARHDYGLTCTNLYAVVYGVADDAKARTMMEWLSGKRIVPGDTSRGSDIYRWGIAPRSNTVAFESVEPNWWAGDFAGVFLKPGAYGEWGVNIENGGAIFYVSFYDILARLRVSGPDDAFRRLDAIMREFHRNELRPDVAGHMGPPGTPEYGVGVSTCFPESGLVPLTMLYGFLGVEPTADGLRVHPALPSSLRYAGVRDVLYHGRYYTITASRAARRLTIRATAKNHYLVTAPNGIAAVVADQRREEAGAGRK